MKQLDVFRDDPGRMAKAWRAAAETALIDVQFNDDDRKRRHDYYLAEAERLEALAEVGH